MADDNTDQPTEQTPDVADTGADDKVTKLTADVEKWKALARKHEADAKAGKDAARKLAETEAAGQSDMDKAVAQARAEAAAEATGRANARLVAAEARALAAEARFRNPATAVRLLDLAEVAVTDDGDVDTDAIKAALDGLAKDEPYLLADHRDTPAPPAQAGIGVAGSGVPADGSPKSLIAAGLSKTSRN